MGPSGDSKRRLSASPSYRDVNEHCRGTHTYAAIDLGTNNCRLLAARASGTGFRVVDSFSRIVRLGEGVAETHLLSGAAMERALDALAVCAQKIRYNHVTHLRAVATEACRRAANRDEFFARAKAKTGIEIESIGQAAEAELALAGCLSLLDTDLDGGHAVVLDIGGGSTQISCLRLPQLGIGGVPEVIATCLMPFGVITLAEKFGGREVDEESYSAMCDYVSGQIIRCNGLDCISNGTRVDQMIGTSGTLTTLAAVILNLPRYVRAKIDGIEVAFDELKLASVRLRDMSYEERALHPCIGTDRADLVIAGCVILEAIQAHWPTDRLHVADRGLRDGILMGLMGDADHEADSALEVL